MGRLDAQEVSGLRAFACALKDRLVSNSAAYMVLKEQPNLYGGDVGRLREHNPSDYLL